MSTDGPSLLNPATAHGDGVAYGADATCDLSVVIVSWNTRDLLADCLASVYGRAAGGDRTTDPGETSLEVLVVDNGSADGSPSMVRERFPEATVVENGTNAGFARANNQAIRRAVGRYVLLLNPDTVVRPGALQALVGFMDANADAGAAGARLLNPDGSLQESCHPSPTLARELWRLFHLDALRPYGRYAMERWRVDSPCRVDSAQGACLILRREALRQVGLLDEGYFIYSEEVDLCYRLRVAGWRVYWVPAAEVVHHGGQSTRQAAAPMFLHLYRGKARFFRQHHGRGAATVYKALLLLAASARLLASPLARFESAPARHRHLALAGNYWRLIKSLPSF